MNDLQFQSIVTPRQNHPSPHQPQINQTGYLSTESTQGKKREREEERVESGEARSPDTHRQLGQHRQHRHSPEPTGRENHDRATVTAAEKEEENKKEGGVSTIGSALSEPVNDTIDSNEGGSQEGGGEDQTPQIPNDLGNEPTGSSDSAISTTRHEEGHQNQNDEDSSGDDNDKSNLPDKASKTQPSLSVFEERSEIMLESLRLLDPNFSEPAPTFPAEVADAENPVVRTDVGEGDERSVSSSASNSSYSSSSSSASSATNTAATTATLQIPITDSLANNPNNPALSPTRLLKTLKPFESGIGEATGGYEENRQGQSMTYCKPLNQYNDPDNSHIYHP